MFGAISPNRESSEHADEQIREKRERVITPASGNVFGLDISTGNLRKTLAFILPDTVFSPHIPKTN